MASYEVKRKKIGAYGKTLAASTVDTVTFADEPSSLRILTNGLAAIYLTLDGSTPTVGGEGTIEIPALAYVGTIEVPNRSPKAPLVVKLISPGTPTYSLSRVND